MPTWIRPHVGGSTTVQNGIVRASPLYSCCFGGIKGQQAGFSCLVLLYTVLSLLRDTENTSNTNTTPCPRKHHPFTCHAMKWAWQVIIIIIINIFVKRHRQSYRIEISIMFWSSERWTVSGVCAVSVCTAWQVCHTSHCLVIFWNSSVKNKPISIFFVHGLTRKLYTKLPDYKFASPEKCHHTT